MRELWKYIKGYENFYQVSNLGNVRSLRCRPGQTHKGVDMKPETARRGYKRVLLTNELGNRKHASVHRLVMKAFLGEEKDRPFVNHKNGITGDNRISNLEWCTSSENIIHSFKVLKRKPWNKGKHFLAMKDCPQCAKSFYPIDRRQVFCKRKCMISSFSEDRKGKHPSQFRAGLRRRLRRP